MPLIPTTWEWKLIGLHFNNPINVEVKPTSTLLGMVLQACNSSYVVGTVGGSGSEVSLGKKIQVPT
jgi:hypothetical protein